jgi:hypothetical protein
MSKKTSGINYSRLFPVKSRRSRVISRLDNQMSSNKKNTKEGVSELTEKDLKRINKELTTLRGRV